MMFEKELEACEEIEELRNKYSLSSEKVFVLRILKLSEISDMNYSKMRDYFKETCKNCETKRGRTSSRKITR